MAVPWIPIVTGVKRGQDVDSLVVNPIIESLAKRDQHLYEKFNEISDKAILIASDIPVASTSTATANSVVFYKVTGMAKGLDLAKIGFAANPTGTKFTPLDDSHVFGIIKSVSTVSGAKKAEVYVHGLIEATGIVASLIQSGETVSYGPMYLSKSQPGKLTSNPGGISIFVGYAVDANKFYLSPQTSALTQFFFNYKFNILDRPAGEPVLDAGIWDINAVDTSAVGWIPVSSANVAEDLKPDGAAFFYNIPSNADIDSDTSLTTEEKEESKGLRDVLPPYPEHFTFMVVNGFYQKARTETHTDGKFVVNAAGVWWFGNVDGQQPWASDINFDSEGNEEQFDASLWGDQKGSDHLRPRMTLQFVKMNPDFKIAAVSSLKSNTPALSFVQASDETKEATAGDILAKLTLQSNTTTESTSTASAIKGLSFNVSSGQLDIINGPVISDVVAGTGIGITKNNTTGAATISVANSVYSGRVFDIEPDNARLEWIGLHSYLNLTDPNTSVPNGLRGKFLLPDNLPNKDLQLSLLMFGKAAPNTNSNLVLNFEYSVSAPTSVIADTKVAGNNTTVAFATTYVTRTAFTVAGSNLIIPASVLKNNAYVNFRLSRDAASTYDKDVGIIGISWKIG